MLFWADLLIVLFLLPIFHCLFKNTAENHNVNEKSMLWNEADIFVKDERERLERLKARLD